MEIRVCLPLPAEALIPETPAAKVKLFPRREGLLDGSGPSPARTTLCGLTRKKYREFGSFWPAINVGQRRKCLNYKDFLDKFLTRLNRDF